MGSNKKTWGAVRDTLGRDMKIGPYYASGIQNDINKFMITLARYKFASKLLTTKASILELGCGEGLGALSFCQNNNSEKVVAVDSDKLAIKWAKDNLKDDKLYFIQDDFMNKEYGKFDAVFSLDVIEHIEKLQEEQFLKTITTNLNDGGFALIGTPNITMTPYASKASKAGHVNMYNQERLVKLLNKEFKNVFIFSMNDEIVHTGFWPMACYIFALCTDKR